MPLPANNPGQSAEQSLIAGSVLPIQRAEELLATLPGVISARIVASVSGAVEEIHILTTTDVTPKQTVRNVESALIAHLGMHVSHKKISVATSSDDGQRGVRNDVRNDPRNDPRNEARHERTTYTLPTPSSQPAIAVQPPETSAAAAIAVMRRRIYFEDVEVRRSRAKGIACRVTLRKGDQTFVGEAEGLENERLRIELAARAALAAIRLAEGEDRVVGFEGCKIIEAFERDFVFAGVIVRQGRETSVVTGSAEIRESAETSSVLAVLDATNRWLDR